MSPRSYSSSTYPSSSRAQRGQSYPPPTQSPYGGSHRGYGGSARQRAQKQQGRRRWAITCGVVLIVLFVAAAGGVLVWAFLPTDTKDTLQSILNITLGDGSNDGVDDKSKGKGDDNKNNNSTTATTAFQFNQCNDVNTNCCNGLDIDDGAFCDLRVNEPLYGLVHNAMASFEDQFFLIYNQNYKLEAALQAGYRALELDVARCGSSGNDNNNDIVFYHGECALGTRQVPEVLENVHSFLVANPSEIVMLFLQMDGQDVSLQEFYQIMAAVDNGRMVQGLYDHHPVDDATEWPTLRELVQSNQRLLVFYWNQDDCQLNADGCPPGFNYWYRYGVNTQWDFGRVSEIQDDPGTSCSLQYTPNGYPNGRDFFRVNAFLRLPSSTAAEDVLNQPFFIQERLDQCSMQNPIDGSSSQLLLPNFYAVDFWDKGHVPEFIQEYNTKLVEQRKRLQQEEEEQKQNSLLNTDNDNNNDGADATTTVVEANTVDVTSTTMTTTTTTSRERYRDDDQTNNDGGGGGTGGQGRRLRLRRQLRRLAAQRS